MGVVRLSSAGGPSRRGLYAQPVKTESMKHLIAFLLSLLIPLGSWAAPVRAKQIEPELGASLGFRIYRYEVKLGTDEVLVVRETSESQGKVMESEQIMVGSNVRVQYEIVLVDSGAFHPSLRNTYMLRFPGSSGGSIEKKWLTQSGFGAPDGSVEFIFSEIGTDQRTLCLRWFGRVEKYSEVAKRWPGLPKPRANSWSGSRRVIEKK
jgi:hypothetical protein